MKKKALSLMLLAALLVTLVPTASAAPATPIINQITLPTDTLVFGYAANLKVNVQGENLNGCQVIAQLKPIDGDVIYESAPITASDSFSFVLALGKQTMTKTAGSFILDIRVVDNQASVQAPVYVINNHGLWQFRAYRNTYDGANVLTIQLGQSADWIITGDVIINGVVTRDITYSNGDALVFGLDWDSLSQADSVSVTLTGVRIPTLFPSYSFTYKNEFDSLLLTQPAIAVRGLLIGTELIADFADVEKDMIKFTVLVDDNEPAVFYTRTDENGDELTIASLMKMAKTHAMLHINQYTTETVYGQRYNVITQFQQIAPASWLTGPAAAGGAYGGYITRKTSSSLTFKPSNGDSFIIPIANGVEIYFVDGDDQVFKATTSDINAFDGIQDPAKWNAVVSLDADKEIAKLFIYEDDGLWS